MATKLLGLLAILSVSTNLATTPAAATATLDCGIDDAHLAFSLVANTNREHGTIVNLVGGELRLKAEALSKVGREFKLAREHIIQQWFQNRELRLAINIDTANGSLLLTLTGRGNQSLERYSGRYRLKASFPDGSERRASGRIKGCSAG